MTDKNFDDLSFDKYSDEIEIDDGNYNNKHEDYYDQFLDDNDDSDILDEQLGYTITQNKNGRGGRRKRENRPIKQVKREGEYNNKEYYQNQRSQHGKQYIKTGNKDYYSKKENNKYYEKDNYYKKPYKDYNYSSTRYENYNTGYKQKKYVNNNISYKKDNYKNSFKDDNYSKHGSYYNNHYDQGKYSMKTNEKTPFYSNKIKKYENGKNYSKQNKYKKQGKGDFIEIEVELSDPPKEVENQGVDALNINAEEFTPKSFQK